MSHHLFRSWGAELSDEELANALAWLGNHGSHDNPRWSAAAAAVEIGRISPTSAVAAWYGHRTALSRLVVSDIGRLAPAWIVDMLRRARGVATVVFESRDAAPRRRWDWPVDVGLLDDDASRALRDAIGKLRWSKFVRFVDAGHSRSPVELLLLPNTLGDAAARARSLPRLAELHTVLVVGGAGDTRAPLPCLESLRAELGAAIAGAVTVPLAAADRWIDKWLYELSHDYTVDGAIFAAWSAHAPETPAPLLFGERATFAAARASVVAERLEAKAARARGAGMKGLPTTLNWNQESGRATEVADLARAMEAARHAADERFLQVRVVIAAQPYAKPTLLLPPGRHSIEVRVGGPGASWSQAASAFPARELPPEEEAHELTVVFVEPRLFTEPQRGTITLPVLGSSDVCTFPVDVPYGVDRLDGRVTVLYRNRILQTVRLRGELADADGTLRLTVKLEAIARTTFSGLAGSAGFDTALFLNDHDGEPGLTAHSDRGSAFVSLRNVDGMVKELRAELEKVTRTPSDYTATESEATQVLLATLARLGARLIGGLRELPGMASALPSAAQLGRRVQVFSIHPDEVVPIELVYDRPMPRRDAPLCPQWRAGLARGECTGSCVGPSREHVCPLGFWGLRHIIERGLYDPADAGTIQATGAQALFRSEALEGHRPLTAVGGVLMASAAKAKNFDVEGFDAAVTEMGEVLARRQVGLETADTWNGWVSSVAAHRPHLLLLLPHTEVDRGAPTLQIGVDTIEADVIGTEHVAEPRSEPPAPGPIVMLLGCRTAEDDVPFASYIAAFRRAGAAAILGTLSTVRGRHMAPVGRYVVDLLVERAAADRPSSLGELVVELRRRLLANDLPVALTFVGFGDVDWLLGGSPS